MALRPVVRRTSAQSVSEQFLKLIRTGTWQEGQTIPSEKELSETLGVGRSTVREALQSLVALNVIEVSSGHRSVVKAPTAAEILRTDVIGFLINDSLAGELLEARKMIEPDCVRLAAQRGTAEDFAEIDALLDEHEEAHRSNLPVAEYGARFHARLAATSHNRVAASLMDSILHLMLERGRRIDDIPNARRKEIDDHRALLSLVKARKADDAAEAMRRHIEDWANTYFD